MARKGTQAGLPDERKLPIRHVEIKNFLSLKHVSVSLGALNVLVGPNGGGKSNFLSVFRFLGEVARTDLFPALQTLFSGFEGTFYRGETSGKAIEISISGEITEHSSANARDEYKLTFSEVGRQPGRTALRRSESILLKRSAGRGRRITLFDRRYEFSTTSKSSRSRSEAITKSEGGEIAQDASALSVLRRIGKSTDTEQVAQLAQVFEELRLFDPVVDLARRPGVPIATARLAPDASNLAGVLSAMREEAPAILEAIQDDIRAILPGFRELRFRPVAGSDAVSVEIAENGLSGTTPLRQASFGTNRALALFAMLRDPDPPLLTCLEEVDHGLHPHALDVLVERLREASRRSQIIVATHSPALVNRINSPELIVFERASDGPTMVVQRSPGDLDEMQQDSGYGLGELWFSGTLGGIPE